jgi:hypothetical protein
MRDVSRLSAGELLAMFRTLEAPALDEMHGEYTARLLQQQSAVFNVAGTASLYNYIYPGHWLSKSFRPVDRERGRGCNGFRYFGKVVTRFPMATLIAPSRFDGRPAFQLVYRAYRSLFGAMHVVDEVRRLEAGRYLGMGTMGFTNSQRHVPLPFLLEGPVGPYPGDLGESRRGFTVESELPALAAGPERDAGGHERR